VGTLVETRHIDGKTGTITIETISRITLKRGGATVSLSETSVEISRLNGRPVSLSIHADQAGLKTAFNAVFWGNSVEVRQDGKILKQPVSPDIVLGYGSEQKIAGLLKSTDQTTAFPFFSSDTQGEVNRTVQKVKQEKGDSETAHRLELKDVDGKTELIQEMLVDKNGRSTYVKSRMMGLTIEFVSDKIAETGKVKNGNGTDILIQTLFHSRKWFPSGIDVQKITLLAKAGEEQLTIPETDFQSVARRGHGVEVTITRPELTETMKPDRNAAALESGPIVQSDLPEIKRIANTLENSSESDADFIRKVVHKVYLMISRKGYGVGFANTATILKTREGDCTEHTVLALALLRAGGIPCRAAAGVVAVNGTIGYHMWPQVAMNGKWISIDPTLNEETADPSHLYMASTLLNDTGFQRDLLPIVQQIGSLSIEPTTVSFRDKHVFDRFGIWREGSALVVGGIAYRLDPGEDFQWKPATR